MASSHLQHLWLRLTKTFILLCLLKFAEPSVKWSKKMKSFSHAIKQKVCSPDKEIVIFNYETGPGVLTEQWFTGADCFNEETRIRYFIDGDEKPTIEMNLYMGHGIGFVKEHNEWNEWKLLRKDDPERDAPWYMKPEDPAVPWGKKRLGHLASGGGLYNTYRVPFQKSIKISFVPKRRGSFWFFVRGVENYPIIIGDIELPKNAELKLYKLENVTMKPFEYALLASTKGRAGMLYQVTMATKSETFGALEACFRAIVDNGNIQYLSSGTEDLFLSAYYYDQGVYHTSHAGLTYKEWPGTMSAYKFFEDDPVLFTNAFKLIWRCGERVDNECFLAKERGCKMENGHTKCTDPEDTAGFSFLDGRINRDLVETVVSTYVWMYEWDTE